MTGSSTAGRPSGPDPWHGAQARARWRNRLIVLVVVGIAVFVGHRLIRREMIARSNLDAAYTALSNRHYDMAMLRFQDALSVDPGYPDAYFGMAEASAQRWVQQADRDNRGDGRPEPELLPLVKKNLDQALALRHAYPQALYYMGVYSLITGDRNGSLRWLDQAGKALDGVWFWNERDVKRWRTAIQTLAEAVRTRGSGQIRLYSAYAGQPNNSDPQRVQICVEGGN